MHPGLSIPVSVVPSRAQRRAELIEPAEEDGLRRIPREQPEDETAAGTDDLDRHADERLGCPQHETSSGGSPDRDSPHWVVRFLSDPEPVHENHEFAGDRYDGSLLRILPATAR